MSKQPFIQRLISQGVRLSLLLLLLLPLVGVACKQQSKSSAEKEAGPAPVTLLLTQAQGLSRLELATVRLKIAVRIDPHRDGFLGFKKLFGSKETRVELRSQASVFCDLRLLTEASIQQRADSTVDLTLPPLEIRRELDDVDQHILQEPTGLRRRLSTNELTELLQSKEAVIDTRFAEALERYRPELIRTAYGTLTQRLLPLFSQLGLRVHLHLAPEDERLLQSGS